MVQATILILSLLVAVILIGVGFYEARFGGYLELSGFLILLIIGLIGLASPLELKAGEHINTNYTYASYNNTTILNHTSSSTTDIYETNTNSLNYVFGLILVLAGLYGILRSRQDIIDDRDSLLD